MNADKLAKALGELPAAYDLLPLFMLPGSRPDMDAPQPSGGHNTRSLLVMAALDLMDVRRKPDADPTRQDFERDRELRIWLDWSDRQVTEPGRRRQGVLPTLSSWVRLVDGELWDEDLKHAAPADTPTVAGECSWLRSHIGWIGEQQWLDEITQDVTGMLRDIREVTGEDDKLEGHMFCTVNNGCGWPVQKVLVTNETTGKEDHYYKCSGCPRSWSRLEVWRLGKQKEPKPIVECAQLAGVSEKTLRRYKDKGFLKVERRQGKTELFDLDAVMRLTMNSRYRQTSAA